MKATVLYYSHTGRTAAYGREIAMYLWSKGLNVSMCSISDFDKSKLKETDVLISGCWTCGWFVIMQHAHKKWKEFSHNIAGMVPDERVMFFTTYKFRTGSMLSSMKKAMNIGKEIKSCLLKSKTGLLTKEDKNKLDEFINNINQKSKNKSL